MAIEIVSFPIKNGGSFHSFLYVYRRVNSNSLWIPIGVAIYQSHRLVKSFPRPWWIDSASAMDRRIEMTNMAPLRRELIPKWGVNSTNMLIEPDWIWLNLIEREEMRLFNKQHADLTAYMWPKLNPLTRLACDIIFFGFLMSGGYPSHQRFQ